MNKKELAIALSRLKPLEKSSAYLEQYATECEIAADVLWMMSVSGNIQGKTIADFGCGNGILGIGALLLSAKKVCFVDIDEKAIVIAKENLKELKLEKKAVFINIDVDKFKDNVDVVVQNPPFGVQQEHADRKFLYAAFRRAPVTYSFHKIESRNFLKKIAVENGFQSVLLKEYRLPIKKTMEFHKKKTHYVDVGVWVFSQA